MTIAIAIRSAVNGAPTLKNFLPRIQRRLLVNLSIAVLIYLRNQAAAPAYTTGPQSGLATQYGNGWLSSSSTARKAKQKPPASNSHAVTRGPSAGSAPRSITWIILEA